MGRGTADPTRPPTAGLDRWWLLSDAAVAAVLMICCGDYLRAHWLTDTFESMAVASGIALIPWSLFTPALSLDRQIPLISR